MKKWVKVVLFSLLGILLILGVGVAYLYYQIEGKYDVNREKYEHNIGYLPNSSEETSFKKCDDDILIGWFASAATYGPVYKGSKSSFKKYIKENYKKVNDTENGFLNLRFIINCEGLVGNMEINQLNTNYEKTELSKKLVTQLVELSFRKENWLTANYDSEVVDSYMYLIYKIENGKIVEILP